jgi:hypothetical protein
MAATIDRHLTKQIAEAGETGLVAAVMIVKEPGGPAMDDGGLARRVIEKAVERTGEIPASVRYVPRANAAVLLARAGLIQEILVDENLAVASAADLDPLWIFDWEP